MHLGSAGSVGVRRSVAYRTLAPPPARVVAVCSRWMAYVARRVVSLRLALVALVSLVSLVLLTPRPAFAQQAMTPVVAVPTLASGAAALQPGDMLRLRIWREPEMSGDFVVSEHGDVVLPKLGPTPVTGRAVEELRSAIVSAYERVVVHSSITVVPMRRIQVLGAVRTPGLYHADPTMTVGDVLALAGGANTQGASRRLTLVRNGRRLRVSIATETPLGTLALHSGDQIYVPERSWISRNPGVVVGIVSAGVSLALTLTRWR